MRPPEFSIEEIVAAGTKLVADNRRVTAHGLRLSLGGGNANRLLQVWEQHLNREKELDRKLLDLPDQVDRAVVEIVDKVDELLRAVLAGILTSTKAAADEQVRGIEAEREADRAYHAENQRSAEEQIDKLESALKALQDETVQLQQEIKEERINRAETQRLNGFLTDWKALACDHFETNEIERDWEKLAFTRLEKHCAAMEIQLAQAQNRGFQTQQDQTASGQLSVEPAPPRRRRLRRGDAEK